MGSTEIRESPTWYLAGVNIIITDMGESIREMTVKELREALKPYGTPYRLSLSRQQLQQRLTEIRNNEKVYGSAEREGPK